MEKIGRDPDHLKILPGAFVVVGDTIEEAQEKRAHARQPGALRQRASPRSPSLGHDASGFDLDGPLPEIPETNASKSGRERAIDLAAREPDGAPARPAPGRLWRAAFVGTPQTIADEMEEWLTTRGQRRLQHHVPLLPGGLDDFVDKVVPELQRRGIFRIGVDPVGTLRRTGSAPRPF
jgi:alkanesulfonate monooxygenase